MYTQRIVVVSLLAAAWLPATATAQQAYGLRVGGTRLVSYSVNSPQLIQAEIAITGINAGEIVVGLDMRPQNGLLYALGVNATSNTATLYTIPPQTGTAGVVGTPGSIAFVDGAAAPIDFPDPATTGWGFDINPAADRVRVVAGSLNFRVDPNAGTPVDGNLGGGAIAGVNPDGPINGATTTVDATAYTNNRPNNGGVTTQYTLDSTSNALYLQNLPNAGTQTLGVPLTLGGNPLDFSAATGFDLPSTVIALASNMPATGTAFAALSVGGNNGLYRIDLATGVTAFAGPIGNGAQGVDALTLQQALPGIPVIGLNFAGNNLVRFSTGSPGTTTTLAIGVLTAGETLVAIDFRPQTGQLYGLGINAVANTGTLYRIDPQTASVTVVGVASDIALADAGGNVIDLPDPATVDFGFDFNPTVDRIRVTAGSNLNFRINPVSGAAVDGDPSVAGNQPDGAIQGSGSTGVEAAAYTNSFGQPLTGGVTTLYTLDAVQNMLFIQNPANAGTQTAGQPVTLGGVPLNFSSFAGLDIPSTVRVTANGEVATGLGYAVLTVGGATGLYAIDLANGRATFLGAVSAGLRGLTLGESALDIFRNGFE